MGICIYVKNSIFIHSSELARMENSGNEASKETCSQWNTWIPMQIARTTKNDSSLNYSCFYINATEDKVMDENFTIG